MRLLLKNPGRNFLQIQTDICCSLFFYFQLIFVFHLFLGMVMYVNVFETGENKN